MYTLLLCLLLLSVAVSGLVVVVIALQELRDWLAPKVRRLRGFDRAPRGAVAPAGEERDAAWDHFALWERELVSS